jgi:hypothetical protein
MVYLAKRTSFKKVVLAMLLFNELMGLNPGTAMAWRESAIKKSWVCSIEFL